MEHPQVAQPVRQPVRGRPILSINYVAQRQPEVLLLQLESVQSELPLQSPRCRSLADRLEDGPEVPSVTLASPGSLGSG